MKKKVTCSECKKQFSPKQIARRGQRWAYCRGCYTRWVKAKTGHDDLDAQYVANMSKNEWRAAQELARNKRKIEATSAAGTRSEKVSDWKLR